MLVAFISANLRGLVCAPSNKALYALNFCVFVSFFGALVIGGYFFICGYCYRLGDSFARRSILCCATQYTDTVRIISFENSTATTTVFRAFFVALASSFWLDIAALQRRSRR
jgi:hypothetical protein